MVDDRILLGMLTPSSNTVLEPVTSAMVAPLPRVSAHFSRFPVVEISLRPESTRQFQLEPILHAARLLADARCQVIAWNGTSSAWLGFETDRRLCTAIHAATGARACTSVLALNDVLQRLRAHRIGLVTPYLDEIQAWIVQAYTDAGFEVVAERHLGDPGNFSFSQVGPDTVRGLVRAVAAAKPDAIAIVCTNIAGAPLVAELERELELPVLDSVAVVVWQALRLAGVDPAQVQGWGRLFSEAG